MKCAPKKITYRLHQSRFVDVTISIEDGFDIPETLKDCIEWEHAIQNNPTEFVNEGEWVVDENDVKDLEWHGD